jgi:hypothetical protein
MAISTPPKPPVSSETEKQASEFVDRGLPIPENYGLDRLVAMVRDPAWIYCYWELHGSILPTLRARRGQAFIDSCAWVLRLHKIDDQMAIDIEIAHGAGNWYLYTGRPGNYQLEMGLLAPDGEWVSLLASGAIRTPTASVSPVVDERWRMRPAEQEAILPQLEALGSTDLGSSRLQSSFGRISSRMLGSSGSQPWGSSGRVSGSSFAALGSSSGAYFPYTNHTDPERFSPGKTQDPSFSVKLPRVIRGLPLPAATWPGEQR